MRRNMLKSCCMEFMNEKQSKGGSGRDAGEGGSEVGGGREEKVNLLLAN